LDLVQGEKGVCIKRGKTTSSALKGTAMEEKKKPDNSKKQLKGGGSKQIGKYWGVKTKKTRGKQK